MEHTAIQCLAPAASAEQVSVGFEATQLVLVHRWYWCIIHLRIVAAAVVHATSVLRLGAPKGVAIEEAELAGMFATG
jgi:hypothetical protein